MMATDPRIRVLTAADYCRTPGHEDRPVANIGGLCRQCDEDVARVHPTYRKTVPGPLAESAPAAGDADRPERQSAVDTLRRHHVGDDPAALALLDTERASVRAEQRRHDATAAAALAALTPEVVAAIIDAANIDCPEEALGKERCVECRRRDAGLAALARLHGGAA